MTIEDDGNSVDIDDVNLDDFEGEFFQTKEEPHEKIIEEDVDEIEVNPLATDDDDKDKEPDGDDEEEVEDEEEDEEPTPQPKAKKNRAQERIEKLLERERLANERAEALEKRLAALEAGKEVKAEEGPALREQLPADAPHPDAKDKDGNPIYELGEFDPQYIRDITKFTIEQEMKTAKEKAEQETRAAQVEAAQEEIRNRWMDNLDKAETEIPEIRENIRDLTEVFSGIDPSYGEFLAASVMNLDEGPKIMNYLSQNIGEAQKIVASGPVAATLALGALQAKFLTSPQQEEKRNTKQVSKAAPPPEDRARGRGGKFTVAPDTDDLNAFEREFFQ